MESLKPCGRGRIQKMLVRSFQVKCGLRRRPLVTLFSSSACLLVRLIEYRPTYLGQPTLARGRNIHSPSREIRSSPVQENERKERKARGCESKIMTLEVSRHGPAWPCPAQLPRLTSSNSKVIISCFPLVGWFPNVLRQLAERCTFI